MADDKQNKKKVSESDFKSTKDIIEANHYNFTLKNIEKTKKVVDNIDKAVNAYIRNKRNVKNPYTNTNAIIMDHLRNSIDRDSDISRERESDESKKSTSPGGIRSISDIASSNPYEQQIIEMSNEIASNAFVQFGEFKAVCSCIPELGKVIKMYSRDILNINDVTKKIFTEIFHKEDFDDSDEYDEETIKAMNEEFIEKVIEENNLEEKIRRYVRESLTKGCNPVSVIPYKEILFLINKAAEESKENLDRFSDNVLSDENLLTPNIREIAGKPISDAIYYKRYSLEDYTVKPNVSIYDEIINGSESTEEYLRSIESVVNNDLDNLLNKDDSKSTEDTQADIDELREKLKNGKLYDSIKSEAKPFLMSLIDEADSKVSVVDHTSNRNLLSIARKTLEKTLKFRNLVSKPDELKITDFFTRRSDITPDSHKINEKKEGDEKDDLSKKYENIEDVLITEYDPQTVIPFIINGKHIGYWVFEEDGLAGNINKSKRNFLSFTDIIKSLGTNDDAALLSGTGVPGVISNMMGFGASGAMSGISSLTTGVLGGAQGFAANTQDDAKKIEMMKDLVIRTVAKRINSPDIAKDKTFRDAMLNLMRMGYITEKKVRITFIPEHYMVYFSYETDNLGLPRPLFADTLLFCYLYISSRIQSLLIKMYKSSNKEVISFNVGANKNIGTSVRTIDRILSTRDTYSVNAFNNITTTMKNSVAHQRLIIPVINGEKLFDYEEMQKANDLSIDDEYTQQLLDSILSVTPIPPSMINKLDEDEYSRSIVSQHINYVNGVVDGQSIYNPQINKLIKLIAEGTKFNDERIKKNIELVDFKLSVPNKLNVVNITNSFNDMQSYIDTMVTYLFANLADNEMYTNSVNEFKLEMAKSLIPEADWDSLGKLKDNILEEMEKRILEERFRAKFSEKNQAAAGDASLGSMGGGATGGGGEEGGEEGEGGDDGEFNLDDFA